MKISPKRLSMLVLTVGVISAGGAYAADGGRPIALTLTGAEEPPNPGGAPPPATGTAVFQINVGQEQVCYKLTAQDIPGTINAAHIHRGEPLVAGPVVVPLDAPVDGASEGCATVTKDLATELIQHPERFYVNVHSTVHPPGAVRAQLEKTQGGPKIVTNPHTH